MTTTDYAAALAAAIPDATYEARFVPQNESRNANDKQRSLNWKVTIKTPRGTITTDYMQGIGHAPGYKQGRNTTTGEEREISYSLYGSYKGRRLPPPAMHDVLWSLLLDADAIDAGGFESWAADLGYDTDSRKAESVYRACVEIGLKLRAMFGDAKLNELRELLRDL